MFSTQIQSRCDDDDADDISYMQTGEGKFYLTLSIYLPSTMSESVSCFLFYSVHPCRFVHSYLAMSAVVVNRQSLKKVHSLCLYLYLIVFKLDRHNAKSYT